MDFHLVTSSNGSFSADLALDGSNDNVNWTNLDNALGITMLAQGYLILTNFSYLKNTAAYKYYRARVTYTGIPPIQPGPSPNTQVPGSSHALNNLPE